ncbi:hypothetical protein L6452_10485 [Arctium lappa]|uniref:Uncharacterized protein n=1 Tax=Arctium lappa TaxID=4217 RepID=A0ACB9DMV2_ARCLA|nr:hypothetical protein L6452_10485 [Arctium lappa]
MNLCLGNPGKLCNRTRKGSDGEEDMVEIRKNKREDNLLKKRQMLPLSQPLSGGAPFPSSTIEKKIIR